MPGIRKILPAILFLASIILCGCNKEEPLLFFNSQPITEQSMQTPSRNFEAGQPVHYILIVPKGFKSSHIRAQIVKKSEKTYHWGYKIYQSRDFSVDMTKKYFINYFVIHEPGYYFMQIFPFNDFDRPLARNDFWVTK
jgi:hypothetical protein